VNWPGLRRRWNDLGARTPQETAVSTAAELIQLRWGGTGHPLTSIEGRIHHEFAR
jgi:xanthine dehydrogenase accessory factor